MRTVPFTKMHGIGNDYVYINCLETPLEDPSGAAVIMADRHFGVGGDGIVLILPSDVADFRMRMFNSDGSEAEMCGNAIRCVAKYLYDRGHTARKAVNIETLAGIRVLELAVVNSTVESVRVDMGEPVLIPADIPVRADGDRVVSEPLLVGDDTYSMTCVSMGNPHCIIFVDEITDDLVLGVGPKIEVHPRFPSKINVEFAKVIASDELEMRVWERGAGETLACGTGASALGVAAVLNGHCGRHVIIHLSGGDLVIDWAENNHVFMTGPGTFVFDGEIVLP
ncbi:MAG: diaminopimelate epimerase [Lentisphaerae bacterium]|jgi:diaminopimelate epimerase|nr:diaminopimelate epimerase [Lentisphaerota bacterium]MBT4819222.1 diaminopimelate epimerase [Lentisphaerota bacterium]MBT5611031.1 diaminopimelate epimerase [Lentisphaerota bacterium]MBT7053973.1 diaminopimelate epimerase [Lentisphaerota bacterium]MBT7841055.1 diaminopimelate epimerase [Lentisphaerota bacterium]